MSNRKDFPKRPGSDDPEKITADQLLQVKNIPLSGENYQTPHIPMSHDDVFKGLADVNEHGPQQLANLIAEGAFNYILFRLSESGDQQAFDYIDECYFNWKQLTRHDLIRKT